MDQVMTLAAALAVVVFHFWACRRSPRYWYLGGIVPLLWAGLLAVLFLNGKIELGEDWKRLLFPTLILLLIWAEGHQAAKKRELEKMKAKDM